MPSGASGTQASGSFPRIEQGDCAEQAGLANSEANLASIAGAKPVSTALAMSIAVLVRIFGNFIEHLFRSVPNMGVPAASASERSRFMAPPPGENRLLTRAHARDAQLPERPTPATYQGDGRLSAQTSTQARHPSRRRQRNRVSLYAPRGRSAAGLAAFHCGTEDRTFDRPRSLLRDPVMGAYQ